MALVGISVATMSWTEYVRYSGNDWSGRLSMDRLLYLRIKGGSSYQTRRYVQHLVMLYDGSCATLLVAHPPSRARDRAGVSARRKCPRRRVHNHQANVAVWMCVWMYVSCACACACVCVCARASERGERDIHTQRERRLLEASPLDSSSPQPLPKRKGEKRKQFHIVIIMSTPSRQRQSCYCWVAEELRAGNCTIFVCHD